MTAPLSTRPAQPPLQALLAFETIAETITMTSPSPKSSSRRTLPQARHADSRYEITFPKRPAVSLGGFFTTLKEAWARGGDVVGDAYASSARVVLDRKEALEDLNAERRFKARAAAQTPDAPADEPKRLQSTPSAGN